MSERESPDPGEEGRTSHPDGDSQPGEQRDISGVQDVKKSKNETATESRKESKLEEPPNVDVEPPLISIQKAETGAKVRRRVGADKPKSTDPVAQSALSSPSTATAVSGKRTAVLSNEARKEMIKLAKAAKDERRATLDARHKYLISLLADGVGLGEPDVEEALISDDKFNLIEEFFAPNGSRKLIFFYQEVKQGLLGTFLFFLRTTNKAITTANVSQEVNFGMLDCSNGKILQSLEKLLSQVMLPALQSQESWGAVKEGLKNPQIQDFLSSVDKFVCSLSSARQNMEGKFQLHTAEPHCNLDNLHDPSDYTAAASNSELVEMLERVLLDWAQQMEQVLTESEQMRKEADDIGPSAELDYWKSRTATFNSILDEIKSPYVKKVLGVLHVSKSKTLRKWKQLDGSITNAANEAKDNVKYLYTLEKFFGPLGKCTPMNMLEHIPRLLNSICLIHNISQYYNTSERMTSLFIKITNQMISSCKAYLSQGVTKVWEHDRNELVKRIKECFQLNREYQQCFQQVREKSRQNPERRQLEFSENYIFGKFDTFCKRLEKIEDMADTMERLASLQQIKIDGVEKIHVRYQSIVTTAKSKTYNVLDHRKLEFDNDYTEFRYQVDGLYRSLQALLDSWFEQLPTTQQKLEILAKFEKVAGNQLDLEEKYSTVLQLYSRDLESIRKLYQKQSEDPPIQRNSPPISGRIMWSRQLFRKIELPMKTLKNKMDILKIPLMKGVIRNYNKIAGVLIEYELLYHHGWCRAVEVSLRGLKASLLIRHPETKELYVNMDPVVSEVLREAKHMHKMGFEVPAVVLKMSRSESQLKALQVMLQEMLNDIDEVKRGTPAILQPLMHPFFSRVDDALSPGLTMLTWTSIDTQHYVKNVYSVLEEMEQVAKTASDIVECRIERVLQAMSCTALLVLPEDDPVAPQAFQESAESTVTAAAQLLRIQSQEVERSVYALIDTIKLKMKPEEKVNLEESFHCLHPDAKIKTRCQSCLPCRFYNMMGQLCQRNTDALVKATKLSLDSLKKRLHVVSSKYQVSSVLSRSPMQAPLFKAAIELAIPNIVLKPSLEEIQSIVNKSVNIVLSMGKYIPLWTYSHLHHKQLQAEQNAVRDAGDDSVITKQILLKPLDRQLCDHKDVTKAVIQLGSIVSSLKTDATDVLDEFAHFSTLWNQDPEEEVKKYLESRPEFIAQIAFYSKLESAIEELPGSCIVGSVLFDTELLKISLSQECRLWKRAFGASLNRQASTHMAEIYSFVDSLSKRLQRPVKDLEDVRAAMEALREVREAEIRTDMMIGQVEESFALLNRHELFFNDGNAERVDSLAYAWKNLNMQVMQTQNLLVKIQPTMKADLLTSVEAFQISVQRFYIEYDKSGPGVEGLDPHEASDRLQAFQIHFDELWRKYITYSGGEELFGFPVNEYPELQRIKRELALLSKLYNLYNSVIDSINGYYDIQWSELDIEKVNSELLDFQNRIRKLPKALKEWQAFKDLKKKIDDFSETCPLLDMMSNKAMMSRHWQRLTEVTKHNFDVESENFVLRNIMQAPLLKNKEEIEDICISAVKEQDIEAKLKAVVAEWSGHMFLFASFKSRGELLLKGSDTAEKVALMEDSLMVLASLMSNRYNAPFKPSIQQWVHKLSNTTEIIEKWLTVQNLWIYLEAVFVGGDIAKQLPQVRAIVRKAQRKAT